MSSFRIRPAVPDDVAAAAGILVALEAALYGTTTYAQEDLEHQWSTLDVGRDVRVLVDGDAVAGVGSLHDRGDLWRVDGAVHPDAQGRGGGGVAGAPPPRAGAGRRGPGG